MVVRSRNGKSAVTFLEVITDAVADWQSQPTLGCGTVSAWMTPDAGAPGSRAVKSGFLVNKSIWWL